VFERYRELQERRANGESEGGFTLIELLIVIIVLGILAAIVIFSLTGVSASSSVAACNTDAKSVETAVAAYDATAGHTNADFTGTEAVQQALLTNGYLHTWPSATVAANGYAIVLNTTTPGEVDVQTGPASAPVTTSYDAQTSTTGCNAA
jgi:general secretion pathway protein G